jgi:FkbM family methyltransferase
MVMMKLKNKFIHDICRTVYYAFLNLLYLKKGMPITVNNYSFRFIPQYHKYYPNNYEQANFRFFAQHLKEGMTCLDIGAQFGLMSILFAKYFDCIVFGFEPTPFTVGIFKKNVELNNMQSKITVIPKAISSKDGDCTFYINDIEGANSNSLINYTQGNEHRTPYKVELTSIDNFLAGKKIDFIKIDAEGEELEVLKGGIKAITAYRPIMLLALHPPMISARGDSLRQIWDLLVSLHYTVHNESNTFNESTFCSNTGLFDVFLLPS